MRWDKITGPVSDTYELLRSNAGTVISTMLKIQAMAMLIIIATLVAASVWILLVGAVLGSGLGYVIAAFIIAGIVVILGLFLSGVADSVGYNAIQSFFSKSSIRFASSFKQNLIPKLKYLIVNFLISLVIFGPIWVIYFVLYLGINGSGSPSLLSTLLELFFRIVLTVVGWIVDLFIQFAIFEILLGGSGAFGSFGKSYRMVRDNFYETFILSFGMWALGTIIAVPFFIGYIVLAIVAILSFIYLGLVGVAIAAVAVILFVSLLVLHAAVTSSVILPCQYRYWEGIRKPQSGQG